MAPATALIPNETVLAFAQTLAVPVIAPGTEGMALTATAMVWALLVPQEFVAVTPTSPAVSPKLTAIVSVP